MARAHILGFPSLGEERELASSLDAFQRGETDEASLRATGVALRRWHWTLQATAGLDWVSVGDFAFYDAMLDHSLLFGVLPARFGVHAGQRSLAQSLAVAHGDTHSPHLATARWFDTRQRFVVPELDATTRFELDGDAWLRTVADARRDGHAVKPTLIGPVTFLRLARSANADDVDALAHLPALVREYVRLLQELPAYGVEWVELDEPILATDLEPRWLEGLERGYASLAAAGVKLLLAAPLGSSLSYAPCLARLPVQGIHVDVTADLRELAAWHAALPAETVLSAGVIDGRNVWRADLRDLHARLAPVHEARRDRLWIAPSCSLAHVPFSVARETRLDADVRPWLAFAVEKLDEVSALARALNAGEASAAEAFDAASDAVAARRGAASVVNPVVRERVAAIDQGALARRSPFAVRRVAQGERLGLPVLPTTTIGSFPQTEAVRRTRAAFVRGEVKALAYLERVRGEIERAVRVQEAAGLDVLVHGEAERSDMVEFFAASLWGFTLTDHGWVRIIGSRCVKPPIIHGDVYRPEPITVDTASYAQSLTAKPVKGVLTGPLTLLQGSFVRDDMAHEHVAQQLALAIRDEAFDLERAGIRIIQIDEPAFREGIPARKAEHDAHLEWAVRAFRLAACGVDDATQVHTHVCDAQAFDILPAIAALDADVVTVETACEGARLLGTFASIAYPNDVGPGVYDVHSAAAPEVDVMLRQIERAAAYVPVERLWVNPDCGLKGRTWDEVETALAAMVRAAQAARTKLAPRANAKGSAPRATAGSAA